MQRILIIDLLSRTSSNFEWDLPEVGAGLLGTLLLDVFHDLDGESPIVISGGAIREYLQSDWLLHTLLANLHNQVA